MSRILLIFLMLTIFCNAQAQTVTRYYDKDWASATKENASFYADFVKDGDGYQCTSYYLQTGRVRGKGTYADTNFIKPKGLQVLYGRNGRLEDSSFYDGESKTLYSYHYFLNGQLAAKYILPEGAKEPVIEGYDEEGKKIKNYIYSKEANFKGGDQKWLDYLGKHLSPEFIAKGNAEERFKVVVEFVVDESGYVTRTKVYESSGNRALDADAVRTIQSSPQWKPAVLYNKPVKAYRRQPVTYVLYPAGKKK